MTLANIPLKIFLTIVLVLILGGGGFLIANWLKRVLSVKADKVHSLKLVNKGNTPSLFHLSIQSTQPELGFIFLFNNIPLVPVFQEVEEVIFIKGTPISTPEPDQQTANNNEKSKLSAGKPKDALKAGKLVAAKSGALAGVLGTLGSFLPGKLGASLKEQAATARNVQVETAKATQAPQLATNKMDAMKSSSGKLGVKSSTKEDHQPGDEKISYAAASAPTSQVVTPVQKHTPSNTRITRVEKTGWVQTRVLASGEALLFSLRIGKSGKRYPVGSFNYAVQSLQVPVNRKLGNPAPVSKTGTVYFDSIANWRYWIPGIGSSLMLLLTLLAIFYGISFIWG